MATKASFIKLSAWSANGLRLDTSGSIIGGLLVAINMLTPEQKIKLLSRIAMSESKPTMSVQPNVLPPVDMKIEYTSKAAVQQYGNDKARWYVATVLAHYEDKAVILTARGGVYLRGLDQYTFRDPK